MVRTNTEVEVNVWKFNLPSIVAALVSVITIIGFIQNQAAERAVMDAKMDLRLTNIETDRAKSLAAYQAWQAMVTVDMNKTPLLDSRLTGTEAGLAATNARMDRQSDAITSMVKGISDLNTSVQLLTQRVEMALPIKKSDMLDQTPNEYRPTKVQ